MISRKTHLRPITRVPSESSSLNLGIIFDAFLAFIDFGSRFIEQLGLAIRQLPFKSGPFI